MQHIDVLNDHDIRDALLTLRNHGFRTYVLERGTICAYKNKACYGFRPRFGRFAAQAISRAISDNDLNGVKK